MSVGASDGRAAMCVTTTDLPDLKLVSRGKVRDVYEVDAHSLLFVATDRLSAFDVVMNNGVPCKGKILQHITMFWFNQLKTVCPNHVITDDIMEMPQIVHQYAEALRGRAMLVKRLKMLDVEAIIRGYITGSGWKEYKKSGTVCGIPLPDGLKECARLSKPLFTPSTKAEMGDHDENIHPDRAAEIMGAERCAEVTRLALEIYSMAHDIAKDKGIILADTKFEFGVDSNGTVVLGDEVLTPDSSRYWPAEKYQEGRGQESFDKQYVRDFLESIKFDKKTPVTLPDDVIEKTTEKYRQIERILTGTNSA